MTSGIYAIKNIITSEQYIGSSKDIDTRWMTHKSFLAKGKNTSKLQLAWDHYGEQSFIFGVIEVIEDVSQLLTSEQQWIEKLEPAYNKRMNIGSNHNRPSHTCAQERARMRREHYQQTLSDAPLAYPPEQIARYLNTTERKIYELLRARELVGLKIGREWRVEPKELEAFIERRKQNQQ
jgi:excisionase family DNA binding protein